MDPEVGLLSAHRISPTCLPPSAGARRADGAEDHRLPIATFWSVGQRSGRPARGRAGLKVAPFLASRGEPGGRWHVVHTVASP
jgi:hypothetical protein